MYSSTITKHWNYQHHTNSSDLKDQCRINHMAEAAYAAGPALCPALTLLYFFFDFLVPCFSAGPKQCAECGTPKSPSPPENVRPQNLKNEVPKSGAPNVFFPVSVLQRGAPKGPRSPENVRLQNLKIETEKSAAPHGFLFRLFQRGIQTVRGPKESKTRKSEAPNW